MIKSRKITCIYSVIITLILLCSSVFLPLFDKTQNKVFADSVDNTLYAFVTKQGNKANDGKIYVDFGISVDFSNDGKITRSDAESMSQNQIVPFESAKIYIRTRNISAITEEGDYEAFDQIYTILGASPVNSMAVKVNNVGLQVGDSLRQFYVEIYKVEITGLKDGFEFKQPNTTREISSDILSTGSEFRIAKKTVANIDRLDLNYYSYLTSPEIVCQDVTKTTSFNDIKINMANIENNWYNKVKYLSDRDMVKLGIRTVLSAYEAPNSIYTDNSFVGLQMFGGDSKRVGAPALQGVPEKNIFTDSSVVEISRWFAKFQSDEREDLNLSDSFNGEFDSVTVQSLFDNSVLLPHSIAKRDYGQKDVYDGYTSDVWEDVFIIDDLNAAFQGSTTFSVRAWKYRSSKEKYYDGYINFIPTNFRAKTVSATLGQLYKDENGKDKIGLSLRFNEPLQFKNYNDGRVVAPYIEGYINHNAANELKFEYVAGEGTDTLFFEADVSIYKMNITSIDLKETQGFEDVYDYAPYCVGCAPAGAPQDMNVIYNNSVNGWDNVSSSSLQCSYDLRIPEIDTNGNISQAVKTSHITTIRTAYVSEKGTLYYGWTTDNQSVPQTLSTQPISAQGFQTIASPPNISGARYLYAYAVSEYGKQSKPMWIGPYNFDNEAPRVSVECIKNTYQEKEFSIHITNNTVAGFERFAELKKNLKAVVTSDAQGKNVVKEISIPLPDNDLRNQSLEVESFTLKAATLGLELGSELEFGTYYLFFTATDILENQSSSKPISYYFDVREIFSASIVKDPSDVDFEMDEFAIDEEGKLVLDDNYYTLDLSKKDLADKSGRYLYFKLKANDDTVFNLAVEEFTNVATGISAMANIGEACQVGELMVVIREKFDAGLYRLVVKDASGASNKKSLPVYFYVTNGKDAATGRYQEETGGYKAVSNNAPLTNKVFQIPTSVSYYYMTDLGEVKTKSYSETNRAATFSSWNNASSYILYREYLDLYAITLTQSFANDLNSGIYRKASGVTQRAEEGQVWIRYKEANWRIDSTTSEWVYYYYGADQSVLPINVNALSNELQIALNTVSATICSYGIEMDLVTEEHFDKYGAPMVALEQMRLNAESSNVSMSGSAFEKPIEYFGDFGMYLSLDPDAPLSTNAILQYGENARLYYKTDGSEYRILTKDSRETFGEYFNATGKFTILELDENGAREYFVYIDKSSPTITITWQTHAGTQSKEVSVDDAGQTISGSNFYFKSLNDYDTLAFVAIYRYTGQGEGDLLSVYRKIDFDNGQGVRLADGKYHVYVSDRSGNSYTFVLQMRSEPLVCTVKEVANSYIRFEVNRDAAEVRYQIYLDGRLLTTNFGDNRFTESGQYRFLIEDIYGNVYDETYIFERELPTVTWRYQLSDGTYALYEKDNNHMWLQKIDDHNYIISTSTYLRFSLLEGCAYQIVSGSPNPNESVTSGWISLNNKTTFTMQVYYEAYPDTYVNYTCTVDDILPQINVSYQKSYYQAFEVEEINEKLKNNEFSLGDNAFIPSFIGFKAVTDNDAVLYVSNGERVQSKYFKVQVSDENGVKDVKVYLNNELILTKTSDFNNVYLSRRGAYQIVATDNFGNVSTFSFFNEIDEVVDYFVDGEKFDADVQFADYFDGTTYTKVEYGNAQAEIKIYSSSEVHYIITDSDGKPYYFAFVVEDGMIYTYQYLIQIVSGEYGLEIESVSARGVKELSSGVVAKIDDIGVAIYLSKNNSGALSLAVRSTDSVKKTYTVETRVSVSQYESPYYFKTKISTIPSSIEFVDEESNLLEGSKNIKVNESFMIRNTIGADVESVQISYSQTGEYKTYETVYDGTYQNVVFSEEGMYHVKVINKYGIQTDYYVVISSKFVMTATLEYADGTSQHYSTEYATKQADFYSNKSVEFIIYATNVQVLDKPEAVSVVVTEQGYTVIYIDKTGDYRLVFEDEYGNRLEKNVSIAVTTLSVGDEVLKNFNDNALRREENYTNQKVIIDKNAVLTEGKIVFINMQYGDKTVRVYDQISEKKTAFDENQYVGIFGDGEYVLVFRDRYGNKAETVVHYCATPTLTILRNTLNGVGAEVYSLEEMMENGVWTNNSVKFSISASEYILTVDGMENVTSIHYDTKTKNDYDVYYLDEYGFKYTFKVHLRREAVSIEPMESMSVSLISDMLVTKDSVQMQFTDAAICTYTLNNEPQKIYNAGNVLYKDGVYRFKVVDKAGNASTYVVKKDSAVVYRFEGAGANETLINGAVTNGKSVRFFSDNSDTAYIKKVFHNNTFIEYDDDIFTERGKWEIIVADEAGNESYFRFYILYGKIDGFSYATPYNYLITSVKWQMEDSVAEATETIKESGLRLEAIENGSYTVTMQSSVTGDVKTFAFTIDKTPPQVELVGCKENEKTINNVTLKGCAVGDIVYVYKDGRLVKTARIESDYMDPPTIKDAGKYKIIVENEAGVKTELTFERKYIPNVAGSTLIIVLSLAAVVSLMVGLIWRNHSKTDD